MLHAGSYLEPIVKLVGAIVCDVTQSCSLMGRDGFRLVRMNPKNDAHVCTFDLAREGSTTIVVILGTPEWFWGHTQESMGQCPTEHTLTDAPVLPGSAVQIDAPFVKFIFYLIIYFFFF